MPTPLYRSSMALNIGVTLPFSSPAATAMIRLETKPLLTKTTARRWVLLCELGILNDSLHGGESLP